MTEEIKKFLSRTFKAVRGVPYEVKNFVPENAHPDLTECYDIFRSTNCDRNITEINTPTFTAIADKLGFESFAELAPQPAYEALKEKQDRPDYGNYDRQTLRYELALLDVLKQDGLDKDRTELLKKFHQNYKPSEEYKRWEKECWKSAFAELASNERLLRLYVGYKPQNSYQDIDEAREQYELRREMFQIISDTMHRAFGIEPVPFYLVDIPADLPLGGFAAMVFGPEYDFIAINYKSSGPCAWSLENAFRILAEEAKHSIDHHMAMKLKSGEMRPNDIRAEHAAVSLSNAETYSITDYHSYKEQYFERNAKGLSLLVSQELTSALSRTYEEQRNRLEPLRGIAPN